MTGPVNRQSVARATLWTVLDFVLERGANFVIIIILARLLSPAEFGIVALLAVFIALATVLSESGLGQALIQRDEIDEHDRSTAFWINMAMSAGLLSILFAIAPFVAAFFAQPQLVPLMQILGVGVVFSAFGTVQRALLLRAMKYRKLMLIRVAATILSGGLAIWMALSGYGVFALAWQACALALLTSVLLWIASDWHPKMTFDRPAARRLLGFGGFMLASSVLETVYSRAYTLFIGKIASPSVLGHFGRADASLSLVQGLVTYPLNQIAFPALSRVSQEPGRMRDGMREALKSSMLINAPAMFGLAAIAEPFMLGAYGDQWGDAAAFLQILCLGGLLMPVHILNLHALMAIGRSDLFFRLEVVKKVVGIGILFVGSYWGAIGIAWGVVIAGLASAAVNTSLSKRHFGYGGLAQIRDIMPTVLLGAVVALIAHAAVEYGPVAGQMHVARLGLGVLTGGFAWAILALAFNLSNARGLLRDLRHNLGKRTA